MMTNMFETSVKKCFTKRAFGRADLTANPTIRATTAIARKKQKERNRTSSRQMQIKQFEN
jgi:hypothetical protein